METTVEESRVKSNEQKPANKIQLEIVPVEIQENRHYHFFNSELSYSTVLWHNNQRNL